MRGTLGAEAKLAALAQRIQLQGLNRVFQSLEHNVASLEREATRQSAELSHLEEQITRLQAAPGAEDLGPRRPAEPDVTARPARLPWERGCGRDGLTARTGRAALPDAGEDWAEYQRNWFLRNWRPRSGESTTRTSARRRGIAGTTAQSRSPCWLVR